ncbi:MAG: C39 family peptidase [Chloroflexota bacterium]|nr:C39 family peptidase [Chloroflexota bacterium]
MARQRRGMGWRTIGLERDWKAGRCDNLMEDHLTSSKTRDQAPLRLLLTAAGTLLLGAILLLLLVGCARYGGAEGLVKRIQVELASQKPHPEMVPTPLPTPTRAAAETNGPSPTAAASTPLETLVLSPSSPSAVESAEQTPDADLADSVPDEPTPTLIATPMAPSASPTAAGLPVALALEGLSHYWQTWNNCGPATLAMNLSYFGSTLSQEETAAVLKPDDDDKNVSPREMAEFSRALGLRALVQVNGNPAVLRRLLDAGVPVLIETWLEPEPNDGMGHYRLLTGFDDSRRQWIVYDSYVSEGVDPEKPYAGIRLSYDETEALWRVFNRTYLAIFDDARAPAVLEILRDEVDAGTMWTRSRATAQAEVERQPDDAYAWFNLGSSLVSLGRYDEAASAFDRARVIGLPWRMLWYQFGPFEAYFETGRFAEVIALADATIATVDNIEEIHFWKGKAYQATGDLQAARAALEQAIGYNPNFVGAVEALAELGTTD